MRFAVESWDPAYDAGGGESSLEPAGEQVDESVEVPLDRWRPLLPPPVDNPGPVVFVDGVRRIDSRVWITDGDDDGDGTSNRSGPQVRAGLCATVAAGAVRCQPGSATIVSVKVERGMHTAAADALPIKLGIGDTYEVRSVTGDDDASLNHSVHRHMTALETAVSTEALANAVSGGVEIVVFDGPLRYRDDPAGVGYVKTHQVMYLHEDRQRVVADLRPGERTPLFTIGGASTRWSWYLRLPGPVAHPLSGVVRLELPDLGDASVAGPRADLISALLPRYASEAYREPRAPQNLHPIAGLERELRRRMGDDHLLTRSLRAAAALAG